MKRIASTFMAFILSVAFAGTAGAVGLNLVPTTPMPEFLSPGDFVSYDLHLVLEGQIGIESFSVGLVYDPGVVTYDPGQSDAADYILYTPAAGGDPAAWLEPTSDPPGHWSAPPPGLAQINVEFIEPGMGATTAVATDVWLATISFWATGPLGSFSPMNLSFEHGGNRFMVDGVDVSDSVWINDAPGFAYIAPEPGTAVLVGLGLLGLGAARRSRSVR